jgi:hypothetical protein
MDLGTLIAGTLSKASTPQDISQWKQLGQQQGANPGGTFQDEAGQKWYVKFPQVDPDQARTEYLANLVYNALGVPAPDSMLVTGSTGWNQDSSLGLANRYIDGPALPLKELDCDSPDVLNGFLADAYLANHDVIGSLYNNIIHGPDDRDYRVDNGSAFGFRAQGGDKNFSGSEVPQIDSMRNPETAREAGPIFQQLTDDALKPQAEHLVATLTDAVIEDLVNEAGLTADYVKALKGRRDAIAQRFGISKALSAWESLAKGWITINGAHVLIGDDGTVTSGPKNLIGMKPHGKLSDKAAAALKNFKPATKEHQQIADANEAKIAKALGGERTPDNAPLDILWPNADKPKVGLEIKTLVGKDLTNVRVNMRPECRDSKLAELRNLKAKGYVVLIDQRGGKAPQYYVKDGMGAFRINQMTPLKNLTQLRAFVTRVQRSSL